MIDAAHASRKSKAEEVRNALVAKWRTSSDREIAAGLGVSNRTVSKHRKGLESEGLVLPRCESTQPIEACLYEVCTSAILPAALNDQLYDPVDESEPSFQALADNILENGILEPIVVSADGYILSGHRRHAAATYLGIDRLSVRNIKTSIACVQVPSESEPKPLVFSPPSPAETLIEPSPQPPSLPRRLGNFATATASHLLAGLPQASQSEIDRRFAICQTCQLFNGRICTHSTCGCRVNSQQKFLNKLAWADQRCPVGKW